VFKRILPWLLMWLLSLTLAGCFQRAGDAFEPAQSVGVATNEQSIPTTDPALVNPPTDAPIIDTAPTDLPLPTDPPPTETLPTQVPPTDVLPPNVTVLPPDTQVDITIIAPTNPSPIIVQPSATAIPPTASESGTTQQVFRTPAPPLGPVTITPFIASDLQATNTPSGLITPTAFSIATSDPDSACSYTIQRGDTLFRIALDNGTTVEALRQANPQISGDLIQPGDVLTLPDCDPGSGQVAPALPTVVPTVQPNLPTPGPGGETTYEIQSGDTLFNIARRFGVTVEAIVAANQISNPDRLRVGDTIIIPPAAP